MDVALPVTVETKRDPVVDVESLGREFSPRPNVMCVKSELGRVAAHLAGVIISALDGRRPCCHLRPISCVCFGDSALPVPIRGTSEGRMARERFRYSGPALHRNRDAPFGLRDAGAMIRRECSASPVVAVDEPPGEALDFSETSIAFGGDGCLLAAPAPAESASVLDDVGKVLASVVSDDELGLIPLSVWGVRNGQPASAFTQHGPMLLQEQHA